MSKSNQKISIKEISRKEAGAHLANYEAVHGQFSLKQAATLRHATYRDPSRLDGCDLIEGVIWILQKATERAATLRDESQAVKQCDEAIKRFWCGFNGLFGDSGMPVVLKIGANTRVWVPKA